MSVRRFCSDLTFFSSCAFSARRLCSRSAASRSRTFTSDRVLFFFSRSSSRPFSLPSYMRVSTVDFHPCREMKGIEFRIHLKNVGDEHIKSQLHANLFAQHRTVFLVLVKSGRNGFLRKAEIATCISVHSQLCAQHVKHAQN